MFIILRKEMPKRKTQSSESQPYQPRKRAGKQPPLLEPPSAPSTTDYPEVQMNLAPELPQSIPGPSYTLGAQETPPVEPLPPHQLQDLAERISTILKDRGSPQSQEEDLETSNQPGVLSQQLNQPQTVTESPFPCMLDVSNVACTPIKVPALSKYLAKYPIRENALELLEGFQFGFKLCYEGPRRPYNCNNLKSLKLLTTEAIQLVNKEINMGRVAGPFPYSPLHNLRIPR
nr:uncharacterized protein LOC117680591 isoform X3 [Crassostrea gigas]